MIHSSSTFRNAYSEIAEKRFFLVFHGKDLGKK